MATNPFQDNFDIRAPKLIDKRSGPYSSLEQALITVLSYQRQIGLILFVRLNNYLYEYWFEKGVLDTDLVLVNPIPEITNEPTGFKSDVEEWNCDIGVEYTASKTIKLTGAFTAYFKGKDVIRVNTGESWESDPCPNVVGEKHYQLRYGDSGWEWVASNAFDYRKLNVAYLYFRSNGDFVFGLRACDGLMQWQSKENFKKKFGTTLESGGDLTDYIKESTTPADRRPLISQTVVSDEDVNTINLAKANEIYTQAYISGANATSNPDQTDIVPLVTGLPQYNLKTGEVYSLAELPNNKVMSVWVYSKPALKDTQSQKYRYVFQVGQWYSDDVIEEKARQTNELYQADLQAIIPRVVYIAQIIIKRLGADWTIEDVVKMSGSQNIQLSISGNYLSIVQTDGTTITGTGTTTDPVKSNVYNADETGVNLPQRSKIQGGDFIEYTDDAVNSKTIVDIKPDKLEEATELESEVIELEQADELETETLLNPDWEETDPAKTSFIQNKPTISGSLWEPDTFQKVGYGYLYGTGVDYSRLCRPGYRIPNIEDVDALFGPFISGGTGVLLSPRVGDVPEPRWFIPDVEHTNLLNFSALPAGKVYADGSGDFLNEAFYMRIDDMDAGDYGYGAISIWYDNDIVQPIEYAAGEGYSVRLVRNATEQELSLADGTFVGLYIGFNGQAYDLVKIASLVCLAQNLREDRYSDGSEVNCFESGIEWSNSVDYNGYQFYSVEDGLYIPDEFINMGLKPIDENLKVDAKYISNINDYVEKSDAYESDSSKASYIKNNPIFAVDTYRIAPGFLYHKSVFDKAIFGKPLISGGIPLCFEEMELYVDYSILGGQIKSRLTQSEPYYDLFWPIGTPITGNDSIRLDILPTGTYDKVNGYENEYHNKSSHWIVNENGELKIMRCYDDILNADIIDYDQSIDQYCAIRLAFMVYDFEPIGKIISVSDYNGNVYSAKKVAQFVYIMMEDLKATHFADGTPIKDLSVAPDNSFFVDVAELANVSTSYPYPDYKVIRSAFTKLGFRLNIEQLRIDVSDKSSGFYSHSQTEPCIPKLGNGNKVRLMIASADGGIDCSNLGDWVIPTYESEKIYNRYVGLLYNHLAVRGTGSDSIVSYQGQVKGYRVPLIIDFEELFSPIPDTGDFYKEIILCSKEHWFFNSPLFFDYADLNKFNFNLVPTGYRELSPSFNFVEARNMCTMHAFDFNDSWSSAIQISFSQNDINVSFNNKDVEPGYGRTVRLCRPANSDELTYEDGTILKSDYIDTNNHIYDAVKIHNLVWLTSNLIDISYANGNSITGYAGGESWNENEGCYCDNEFWYNFLKTSNPDTNLFDKVFIFNKPISEALNQDAFAKFISYAELIALIDTHKLQIGRKYLIYDFKTTWNDYEEIERSGNPEALLVTASGYTKLCPEAYSLLYPNDIIYYSPINDNNILNGCTKGYIYRRVDMVRNIDIHGDWRSLYFKRYKVSGGGITWPNNGYASPNSYSNWDFLNLGITVNPSDWRDCYIIPTDYPEEECFNIVMENCPGFDATDIYSRCNNIFQRAPQNIKIRGSLNTFGTQIRDLSLLSIYNCVFTGSIDSTEIVSAELSIIGAGNNNNIGNIEHSIIKVLYNSTIKVMSSCNIKTMARCIVDSMSGCIVNNIKALKNNKIHSADNLNFNAATHVYAEYDCEIYKRPDGTYRLRYYNDSDVLTIVSPTS